LLVGGAEVQPFGIPALGRNGYEMLASAIQPGEEGVGILSLVEEITHPECTVQIDQRDWDPSVWAVMINAYRRMVPYLKKVFRKNNDPSFSEDLVGPAGKVLGHIQF
jgi:hypothetical protein